MTTPTLPADRRTRNDETGELYSAKWAQNLYQFPSPYDYKILYGGRGSSKTYEATRALITLAHNTPLRICVAREHQVSIKESAQPELKARADEMGLLRPDCFTVTNWAIDHANGSHIFFRGLSSVSEEDLKGMAMVDIVWVEEAHKMSHSSWEILRPTIRKDNAEIWATFNPKYRTDAIWKFSQRKNDPAMWTRRVRWRDNINFTDRNNRDRMRDKKENPERYAHIWDGEPDDASAARKVIPMALLNLCVEHWDKRPQPRGAIVTSGLDVADTGADYNAFTLRSGPELFAFARWRGSLTFTTSETARKAAKLAGDEDTAALYYDIGGPGAGIRGPMLETDPDFSVRGCHFGGKVLGPKRNFTRGAKPKTNEQYFFNWAAQAGWHLRLRAEMTQRLVKGEPIDPHDCLFINPDLPYLEDFLAELGQPEFDDSTGKMRINKQPHGPGEQPPPSPDGYDSAIMAFSHDIQSGLRSPAE